MHRPSSLLVEFFLFFNRMFDRMNAHALHSSWENDLKNVLNRLSPNGHIAQQMVHLESLLPPRHGWAYWLWVNGIVRVGLLVQSPWKDLTPRTLDASHRWHMNLQSVSKRSFPFKLILDTEITRKLGPNTEINSIVSITNCYMFVRNLIEQFEMISLIQSNRN